MTRAIADDEFVTKTYRVGALVQVFHGKARVTVKVVEIRRGKHPRDHVYVVELLPKVHAYPSWAAKNRSPKRRRLVRRAHAIFALPPEES